MISDMTHSPFFQGIQLQVGVSIPAHFQTAQPTIQSVDFAQSETGSVKTDMNRSTASSGGDEVSNYLSHNL